TPGYRPGVDANDDRADGYRVHVVPQPQQLGTPHEHRDRRRNQAGDYAGRNASRGPDRDALDPRGRGGRGGPRGGARPTVGAAGRDCLRDHAGDFAVRIRCRGPGRHALDARVGVGLGGLAGWPLSVYVEGLDLHETEDGLIDEALLLVDPDRPLTGGVGLPTIV